MKDNKKAKITFIGKMITYLDGFVSRFVNLYDVAPGKFTRNYFLSLIDHFNQGKYQYRDHFWKLFYENFNTCNLFRIIKSKEGTPVFIKIVLIFHDPGESARFIIFLESNKIAYIPGYEFLDYSYPSYNQLRNRVVELPIDWDERVNTYLLVKIREYIINGNH